MSTAIRLAAFARIPISGPLSTRPTATVAGQRFKATDVVGGTMYESLDGSTWTQEGASQSAAFALVFGV